MPRTLRFYTGRLRGAALLLLALTAVPRSAHAQPTPFGDAHVHLNDPAAWVELMDRHGIERAVVMRGRAASHEELLAAAARWPGRLLPLVSVSPEHREYRGAWQRDEASLAAVVDSLLSLGGFHGIGEISVTHFPSPGFPEADFSPSGTTMRSILEVARRHDVPVWVHAEITRLRELEEMLAAFPDVQVVLAHGGYTPLFIARRLLEAHPNLTYEFSARTWPLHPRSPEYTILEDGARVWQSWLQLIESLPARFIVGTDASLRSAASDLAKIESVQGVLAQLSPTTRAAVARDNLERLLEPGSRREVPR